jgi:hypothetical protein
MTSVALPHDCNAYCRDDRHAHTVFVRQDFAGRERASLADLCEQMGVRFVFAEPAPEAPWQPPEIGFDPDERGGWRKDTEPLGGDPADYAPWLLIWEESWQRVEAPREVAP